jgi:hypothetical protein
MNPAPGTYEATDEFRKLALKARASTAPLRAPEGLSRPSTVHPGYHSNEDTKFIKRCPLIKQLSVPRNGDPGPGSYNIKGLAVDGHASFNFVHMQSVVKGKQKSAVPRRVRLRTAAPTDITPAEEEALVLLHHKYRMKARPGSGVRDLADKLGFGSTAERDCGVHFQQQF